MYMKLNVKHIQHLNSYMKGFVFLPAIRLHESDPLLWSNRAAARLAVKDSGPALKDAMQGARQG